jgi:lipopolysaccharide/colanic/teichoic acid biosynthesis glycosyltransferase
MQLAEDSSVVNIPSCISGGRSRTLVISTTTLLLERSAKRTFDILVAVAGLVIFSPLFLLAALAVVIESRGPAFCCHVGRDYSNKSIRSLRFRTTRENGGDSRVTSMRARLTRVGTLLRVSGIEGLPQLINILRGEMSIVGPQLLSVSPSHLFQEQLSQLSHCKVKSGIIGWAQLSGSCRGSVSSPKEIQRQIERDVYYVENWSFLLDVKIVLMTLFSKAAYQ